MEQNALFRKAALDKLASPERLDVLMRVTSPMGWVALLTIAGILAGVIGWSIFGSIPERIDGQGVLLRGGAMADIRSTGTGSLARLDIRLNDVIEVGQVVGTIAATGNEEEVAVAQRRLNELRAQRALMGADSSAGVAQAEAQIANLQGEIGSVQAELQGIESRLATLRDLRDKKVIPNSRVETVEAQRSGLIARINALKGQINAQRTAIRNLRSSPASLDAQIGVAEAELKRVLARTQSQETIRSTVAGRVVEIKKNLGDAVKAGDSIASIEPLTSDVEVVAFVSADVGKRIQEGMPTEVSPTDVKREEYGFMRATVARRGDFAAGPDYVMTTLRNEAVARKLIGSGPVFEVRARLKEKPSTPSGFEWSTSEGPPFKIGGGTLVNVAIIVERKRPITLVMPFLRKTFGIA
ncbi:MAG TPA: NHLP bacteriocin system secretion protein [Vicinamibacterales bacterium]